MTSQSREHHLVVGTFNTPHLYTLSFTAPSKLEIVHRADAVGSHSWLHLSPSKKHLYATAWTEPPTIVAYAVDSPTSIRMLGSAQTASRSGYVTANDKACYSAGGATGEVFALDPKTGGFVSPSSTPTLVDALGNVSSVSTNGTTKATAGEAVEAMQHIGFVDTTSKQKDDGSVMDFGGLRNGAHSADLSPDGRALYIADIGRSCIWTYAVDPATGALSFGEKSISPRAPHDGPRHVWPHPSGKYVYCLQEHSSMVDVFETSEGGTKLKFVQGVRIIPEGLNVKDFWADEVRTSFSPEDGAKPKWLYASTRGLKDGVKGYVAVFKLDDAGRVDETIGEKGLSDMWQTPTSGGWANAIQPGPTINGVEYCALTDSEQGFVMVISWDGKKIQEVARVKLDEGAGAATAVWLS